MKPLPASAWLMLRCALQRPRGGELPSVSGHWQAPAINDWHRRRFNAQLGFPPEALPLSYHYLALQRAQLAWMLQPAFPYRLLGMVHIEQRLERVAPWQRELGYELHLEGRREGKRNLQLSVDITQQGVTVLRSSSLYRPPREGGNGRMPRERAPEAPPDETPLAHWALPADAGRRYALLSGDANPIHLGTWGARLFGMRSPIIHGAHTMARCEAALGGDAQRITIRFLKLLALPGEAALYRDGDGYTVWGAAGRCAELEIN